MAMKVPPPGRSIRENCLAALYLNVTFFGVAFVVLLAGAVGASPREVGSNQSARDMACHSSPSDTMRDQWLPRDPAPVRQAVYGATDDQAIGIRCRTDRTHSLGGFGCRSIGCRLGTPVEFRCDRSGTRGHRRSARRGHQRCHGAGLSESIRRFGNLFRGRAGNVDRELHRQLHGGQMSSLDH